MNDNEKNDQIELMNSISVKITEIQEKISESTGKFDYNEINGINEFRTKIIRLSLIRDKVLDDFNYLSIVNKIIDFCHILPSNCHISNKIKKSCLLTTYNLVVLMSCKHKFDNYYYDIIYDEFLMFKGSHKFYAALILSQWCNLNVEIKKKLIDYFKNILLDQGKTKKVFGIDFRIISKILGDLEDISEVPLKSEAKKIKLFMKDIVYHDLHTNIDFDISEPIKKIKDYLPCKVTKDALQMIYIYNNDPLKEELFLRDYGIKTGSSIYYVTVMKPPQNLIEYGCGGLSEVLKYKDLILKRYKINKDMKELSKPILLELSNFVLLQNNPNVVKLRGLYRHDNDSEGEIEFYIALEDTPGGNLEKFMKDKGVLKQRKVLEIVKQVVDVIKHIHKKKLIHRNIKCSSIYTEEKEGKLIVKLSNFGLSKYMHGFNKDEMLRGIVLSKDLTFDNYLAPEVLNDNLYGSSSDIWSVGVLMLVLLGRPPFNSGSYTSRLAAISADPPRYDNPPGISENMVRIIKSCLTHSPLKRPTAEELSKEIDDFLKSNEEDF